MTIPRSSWLDPRCAAGRGLLVAACLAFSSAGGSRALQQRVGGAVRLPDRWLQGFVRAGSGEVLVYPWAYPGQARALLTRATTGKMRIEWEGESLPPGVTDDRVSYLWHAGLASGHGAHRFTLSLNGAPVVVFTSGRDTSDREWSVAGASGSTLAFKATRVGTFRELFGFMWLTVPRALVAGGPPVFAVAGEAASDSDYYMTFEEGVSSWTRATAEEARFRDGSPVLRVSASRTADAGRMTVRSRAETLWQGELPPGYFSTLLPLRGSGSQAEVTVEIDGVTALFQRLTLPPVRDWEIHLLPHSHVDVGYSDPQPEVEQKQWKNLREAVELCAATRGYPPGSQFKWNVEGLWSVESYLRQASEPERQRFIAEARSGAIDLQANYTNILTGLATPRELEHWTDGARRLQKQYGLGPMPTAMHTDVPGLCWTAVRPLARAGVRYFSSGPNYLPGTPDLGDRIGGTLAALGDRPFWWTSPSGEERLLFWMAGRGYSWFHGMNLGPLEGSGRQPLLDYVRDLRDAGYPYDMVQVRYTTGGDNGPVDPRLPDTVRAWNETFASPRLVIDTAAALFTEFERRYGTRLPVRRGDMTPYWEDGALSTAAEESLVRAAARRLQQAEAAWALRAPAAFPAGEFADAWRAVTMWHEHTWGAADSITDPDRKDVVAQWLYKRQFAARADTASRALLQGALAARGDRVEVVNTLSWPRDELVRLSPAEASGRRRIVDEAGSPLPSQLLADGRLAVWVAGVPALGSRRLQLVDGPAARPAQPVSVRYGVLDNGRVLVGVDVETGDIRSVRAAAVPGIDFAAGPVGVNAYEYVAGLDPSRARPAGPSRIVVEDAGPLVATLRIETDAAPGTAGLTRRVTLAAGDDRVWLETVVTKRPVRDKESGHLAFPFNLPDAVVRVDEGEALVSPATDLLPGSCLDFIGVHSAADVSIASAGITLVTLDAPLVEIGSLTDERRRDGLPRTWKRATAPGPALFAYLFNNYWHTNYKADQEGELRYRFVLQAHGPFDAAALRRASAVVEQPLLLSRTASGAAPMPSPFHLESDAAVVSTLVPLEEGRGLRVEIYNPTPTPTRARLSGLRRGWTLMAIDAGGRRAVPDGAVELGAFGSVILEMTKGPTEEQQ